MKTIKLSYSILNAWEHYQYEQAIAYYLGKDVPPTPQMELGRAYDELWEKHIISTKTLPAELGGGELIAPMPQTKFEKILPLNDEYQILFRGVPDCPDDLTIYEFKCGMTEASQYLNGWQADAYKLLYPQANIAKYLCYNPYFDTHTVGIKFLGRGNAEYALNKIYSLGTEFIDYLIANRLVRDYKR